MKKSAIVVVAVMAVGVALGSVRPASAQGPFGGRHGGGRQRQFGARPRGGANRRGGGLGLTDAQRTQLQQLRARTQQQVEAIREDTTLLPREKRAKFKMIRDAMRTQISQILTPQQFQKWQQLREKRQQQRNNRANGSNSSAPAP